MPFLVFRRGSFEVILGDPGAVSGGGKKSFLTFLRPNFFLARFDFFPPPLTAPGSPRMI